MELYAAMVESLDHHVGRLVEFLKQSGHYDDTLILFLSDNGPEGNPIERMRTNAEWLPRRFDNSPANLGRVGSYAWLGPAWAQATTPFRLWKAFPTEGGVRVPAIARYGTRSRRGTLASVVTVKDVAPTVLELAGVRHPGASDEGRAVAPIEGRSLLPFLEGRAAAVHGDELHDGLRALRPPRPATGALQDRLALRALRAGALGALRSRGRSDRVARPRGGGSEAARSAGAGLGRVRRDRLA